MRRIFTDAITDQLIKLGSEISFLTGFVEQLQKEKQEIGEQNEKLNARVLELETKLNELSQKDTPHDSG